MHPSQVEVTDGQAVQHFGILGLLRLPPEIDRQRLGQGVPRRGGLVQGEQDLALPRAEHRQDHCQACFRRLVALQHGQRGTHPRQLRPSCIRVSLLDGLLGRPPRPARQRPAPCCAAGGGSVPTSAPRSGGGGTLLFEDEPPLFSEFARGGPPPACHPATVFGAHHGASP